MKASLCRDVIYEGDIVSNSTKVHPAKINRVWSDTEVAGQNMVAVNIMVFPDCGTPQCRSSVALFENKVEADKFRASQHPHYPVCYFPDRV